MCVCFMAERKQVLNFNDQKNTYVFKQTCSKFLPQLTLYRTVSHGDIHKQTKAWPIFLAITGFNCFNRTKFTVATTTELVIPPMSGRMKGTERPTRNPASG